jgi:hypothetical protein
LGFTVGHALHGLALNLEQLIASHKPCARGRRLAQDPRYRHFFAPQLLK